MIGPNGAGKSLLLNIISGWMIPNEGTVLLRLNGGRIMQATKARPESLARAGLGRLWQDIRLHPHLSVLESVLLATPHLLTQDPFYALAGLPYVRKQEREARDRAMHCLAHFGLDGRANSLCGQLSVGEMKRVALARLLQMEARLWLLDEPLAGVDDATAEVLIEDFRALQKQHFTLLIVEHQGEKLAAIAGRTWFLQDGRLTVQGESHV
jgi:ABC-type branched-subunit amino acid transport system ATPase component